MNNDVELSNVTKRSFLQIIENCNDLHLQDRDMRFQTFQNVVSAKPLTLTFSILTSHPGAD